MAYGWLTHDGFTVSVWFKRTVMPTTAEFMFHQSTQNNVNQQAAAEQQGRQFSMHMNGIVSGNPYPQGSLGVRIINEGTATETGDYVYNWNDTGASYADDGEWHNFVVRLSPSGRTVHVFVDGQVVDTVLLDSGDRVNWAPGVLSVGGLWVPAGGVQGAYFWNGSLAHVMAANVYWSDSQIESIWAAGSGGTVYYGDNEVTRLNRILDWADTPEQSRELDPPLETLQGIEAQDATALDKVQETADATGGLIFADGQSRVVYHNRRHRYGKQAVIDLSESTASAPEMNIVFTVDDQRIYNDIIGKRPYGGTIRMQDPVSVSAFGRKNYPFSIAVTSHESLRNAVAWLLSQYSREQLRVSAVSFRAESSEKISRMAKGFVQIGDVIRLSGLPAPAPADTLDFVVEKIDIDADFVDRIWTVTYQLTPKQLTNVAQLGVTYLGDDKAVIGY